MRLELVRFELACIFFLLVWDLFPLEHTLTRSDSLYSNIAGNCQTIGSCCFKFVASLYDFIAPGGGVDCYKVLKVLRIYMHL